MADAWSYLGRMPSRVWEAGLKAWGTAWLLKLWFDRIRGSDVKLEDVMKCSADSKLLAEE
jgi:hypothetical protein